MEDIRLFEVVAIRLRFGYHEDKPDRRPVNRGPRNKWQVASREQEAVGHGVSGTKANHLIAPGQQTSSASTNIPRVPVAARNRNEEDALPVRL